MGNQNSRGPNKLDGDGTPHTVTFDPRNKEFSRTSIPVRYYSDYDKNIFLSSHLSNSQLNGSAHKARQRPAGEYPDFFIPSLNPKDNGEPPSTVLHTSPNGSTENVHKDYIDPSKFPVENGEYLYKNGEFFHKNGGFFYKNGSRPNQVASNGIKTKSSRTAAIKKYFIDRGSSSSQKATKKKDSGFQSSLMSINESSEPINKNGFNHSNVPTQSVVHINSQRERPGSVYLTQSNIRPNTPDFVLTQSTQRFHHEPGTPYSSVRRIPIEELQSSSYHSLPNLSRDISESAYRTIPNSDSENPETVVYYREPTHPEVENRLYSSQEFLPLARQTNPNHFQSLSKSDLKVNLHSNQQLTNGRVPDPMTRQIYILKSVKADHSLPKGYQNHHSSLHSIPQPGASPLNRQWFSSTHLHSEPPKSNKTSKYVSIIDMRGIHTRKTTPEPDEPRSLRRTSSEEYLQNAHRAPRKDEELELVAPPADDKETLLRFIEEDIIRIDEVTTQFGRIKATYVDYVASGRPLKCFETYIRYNVLPSYANTHTEVSHYAKQTTRFREEAREIIRECVNASVEDAIIFTGSGATSAINKLVYAMNIKPKFGKLGPTVFVGPYEHHSNILPWRELKAVVITVPTTSNGLIDLDFLEQELKKCRCGPERTIIGSFSAASNVTGILTDVNSIAILMHKYNGYVFFDYACAAPYVEIDMNPGGKGPDTYKDAIFISPHKFIGGPQTPGILIAKRYLFKNPVPHGVGGGTVSFVRRATHSYLTDVEHREEGGTPAITESIRAGLVFKLKAALTPQFIMQREDEMFKIAAETWQKIPDLLILGSLNVQRLPIFSMLFMNKDTGRLLHHDFVATILNDVFGIQVRSGCACAAPYGLDLLGMTEAKAEEFQRFIVHTKGDDEEDAPEQAKEREDDMFRPKGGVEEEDTRQPCHSNLRNVVYKPGFVRLNFPYFMSQSCFNFILKAVEMTARRGWVLLPLYDFDRKTSSWWYREKGETDQQSKNYARMKSLYDISFRDGRFQLLKRPKGVPPKRDLPPGLSEESSPMETLSSIHSSFSGFNYDEILERAKLIFDEASKPGRFDRSDQTHEYTREADQLRWFMLPSEAADVINNRPVRYVDPQSLPFLPEALREKMANQKPPWMSSSEEGDYSMTEYHEVKLPASYDSSSYSYAYYYDSEDELAADDLY